MRLVLLVLLLVACVPVRLDLTQDREYRAWVGNLTQSMGM